MQLYIHCAFFDKFLHLSYLLLYKICLSHFILSFPFLSHFPNRIRTVHVDTCVYQSYITFYTWPLIRISCYRFPNFPPSPALTYFTQESNEPHSGIRRCIYPAILYIIHRDHMHACMKHACEAARE